MANVVSKIHLVKSDPEKNNNKFWNVAIYDDGSTERHWGRVGDSGQRKLEQWGSTSRAQAKAESWANTKRKEGRNGEIAYRDVDVIDDVDVPVPSSGKVSRVDNDLHKIAKDQIKTNCAEAAALLPRLIKENAHQITAATGGKITYNYDKGMFQTPLGLVRQASIDEARAKLVEIGDLVYASDYGRDLLELTRDYLMLVPQDIGRHRLELPVFWRDLAAVQKQNAILDGLEASLAQATKRPAKRHKADDPPAPQVFDVRLDLVTDKKVIDMARRMYNQTRQLKHACQHLDVKRVFEVEIATEREAFERDGAKMNNVWQLWHGTRVSNVLSILKQGLIIPPSSSAHCTGRLFGNGVYASDQSTKALNYAYGITWGTGPADNNCFMFLLDMSMGNYYVPSSSSYNLPKPGYDSTFAKGGKSGVINNEMIVYRTSQVRLNYLVEFSPGGK